MRFDKSILQENEEESFIAKMKYEQKLRKQLAFAFDKLNNTIYHENQISQHHHSSYNYNQDAISLGQFDFQPHVMYKQQRVLD